MSTDTYNMTATETLARLERDGMKTDNKCPYPARSPAWLLWCKRRDLQDTINEGNARIADLKFDIQTIDEQIAKNTAQVVELDAAIKLLTGEVAP